MTYRQMGITMAATTLQKLKMKAKSRSKLKVFGTKTRSQILKIHVAHISK